MAIEKNDDLLKEEELMKGSADYNANQIQILEGL